MAIQVGRAILPFTVNGFVGFLQDCGPSAFHIQAVLGSRNLAGLY
jgi:hypothetical protein